MKRIIAFVLCLMLITSCMPFSAANAAGTPMVRCVEDVVQSSAGTDVSVEVIMENNPGIVSGRLSIAYDEDIITLTSVKNGAVFDKLTEGALQSPFLCAFVNTEGETASNENATLVTLNFHISDAAQEGDYSEIIVLFNDAYIATSDPSVFVPVFFSTQNGLITTKEIYVVNYFVDNEPYGKQMYMSGAIIEPLAAPEKEGNTFSGWRGFPNGYIMPAQAVRIDGSFSVNKYMLSFYVDNEFYSEMEYDYGEKITPPDSPVKVGYTFAGWRSMPATMPARDTRIDGSFNVNSYSVTYLLDGVEYATQSFDYGETIKPIADPAKTGYTFSGWVGLLETMPARNITVTGSFEKNAYTLSYFVDGELYSTESYEYGATIIPLAGPAKTGHTFLGWQSLPSKMPANDLSVNASYRQNTYELVYYLDGNVYASAIYKYGETIVPVADPTRTGYEFSGWLNLPATMPASNVRADGSFSKKLYTITYYLDNEVYRTVPCYFSDRIVAIADPQKIGYEFSGWDGLPANMPANDINVYGKLIRKQYTITYFVDNAEYAVQQYYYGDTITPLEEPVRDGFTFSGWSTIPMTMPANSIRIDGTFAQITYVVDFVDWDGSVLKSQTIAHGQNATAPTDPEREGYTFIGWDNAFDNVVSNLTVTAQYTINKYRVLFYDWNGVLLKEQTVNHGSGATAPTNPTREGYSFTGWDKAFDNITDDTDVYATYSINKYTVCFVDWDDTILKEQIVDHGTAATAPANPTRIGYIFQGWDKAFNNITSDMTITATYSIIVYTVTFVDWDGTVLKTESVNHGGSATSPVPPTRIGYSFNGWDKNHTFITEDLTVTALYVINVYTVVFIDSITNSTIITVQVEHGADAALPTPPTHTGYHFTTWDSDGKNITENTTITAHYAINVYTVTFVDWDGAVLKNQTVNHGASATAPNLPMRTGYTFSGWDKAFDSITSDLTVTATYTINVYTVTFKDWEGTVLKTEEVEFGQAATAPADPTRVGYTFTGWDKAFDNVRANLNVHAEYVIIEYTVTFVDGMTGEIILTATVEHGADATLPTPPEHDGYDFIGWDSDGTNITEDMTITAQYEQSYELGDVNGDGTINTGDAVTILRQSVGLITLTEEQNKLTDFNGDGNVNTGDAVSVLRYCVGLKAVPFTADKNN